MVLFAVGICLQGPKYIIFSNYIFIVKFFVQDLSTYFLIEQHNVSYKAALEEVGEKKFHVDCIQRNSVCL